MDMQQRLLAVVYKWLVDSGTSRSLTSDLANLSIHSEYNGTDGVQLVDGTALPITHVGTTNVLCVPSAPPNLLYVHQFTNLNMVYIQCHPLYFRR